MKKTSQQISSHWYWIKHWILLNFSTSSESILIKKKLSITKYNTVVIIMIKMVRHTNRHEVKVKYESPPLQITLAIKCSILIIMGCTL